MSFAVSLAGSRAVTAVVTQPARGLWHATVEIDEPRELATGARVTLKVGDLELSGTVVDGRAFKGTAEYSVVAGRGGWRRVVRERSQRQDKGVKLSSALKDLAADSGEEWAIGFGPGFVDRSVGYCLARPRRVASEALAALIGRAWYVGDDGKTVVGDRPAGGKVAAEVLDFDPVLRTVRLGTLTPSKVRPGQTVVVDGTTYTLERVTAEVTAEAGTISASCAPASEQRDRGRLLSAVRAIVRELFPRAAYAGDVEYTVAAQNGALVDLRPVDASLGMPVLSRVQFRGAPGVAGVLPGATRVLVRFVDSDPGRPYVSAVAGADGGDFVPTSLRVDASETVAVGESADLVELAGGAEGIPRDDRVEARLQELASAILNATPTPNDGGAAIQTAAKAVLQGIGWSLALAPPSTASDKGKVT